jgi:peptidyl-tRNA hydrolase
VKTKRFTRIRVGVSPSTATGKLRKPAGDKEVADFILARFKAHEMDELKKVFKKIAEAIECIVMEGPQIAMNRFN